MRARAVIGANFGDEGKGLVTDYLCAAQGAGMVVRYNGGAQAGHTVVTPDGQRHIFSHVGAGSFCGVPTFLSQFFVCNPILFLDELKALRRLGINPTVYAHPNCLVTTFADMLINQTLENRRGDKRHGSCGIGFNETQNRSQIPELKITMSDLWNNTLTEDKLRAICGRYTKFRTNEDLFGVDTDPFIAAFLRACGQFSSMVHPLGMQQCPDPVFEGAQGLLLDQDNKEFFPHLTRSNTGMKNVRILCDQAGITDITAYYVSRTYLTRHGAGPLPGEDTAMHHTDDTNERNDWQGALRFAPLDHIALHRRCLKDAGSNKYKLVMTHCDQVPEPRAGEGLLFHGPTRNNGTHFNMMERIA